MSKHEFTCPDVIYLRKRAKRNALIQVGLVATLATAATVSAWWTERKENNVLNVDFTPEDLEV